MFNLWLDTLRNTKSIVSDVDVPAMTVMINLCRCKDILCREVQSHMYRIIYEHYVCVQCTRIWGIWPRPQLTIQFHLYLRCVCNANAFVCFVWQYFVCKHRSIKQSEVVTHKLSSVLATSLVQHIHLFNEHKRDKTGSHTAGVQDKYAVYKHYCDVDMCPMT